MVLDPTYAAMLTNDDLPLEFSEEGEEFSLEHIVDTGDDYLDFNVIELATGDPYSLTYAAFDVINVIASREDPSEEVFEPVEIDG